MKKTISLFLLLLVCSWASADSLERFVDRYKDKGGAVYKVINANSKLDDLVESGLAKGRKRASLLRGTLVMMGVEEVVIRKLKSSSSAVRGRFFANVLEAIPESYTVLAEKGDHIVYVNNYDEDYAYVLIVNNSVEKPRLTRLYVTNNFLRAIMNDEGTAVDNDKFERYLEDRADKLEESAKGLGRSLEEGMRRLEERITERQNGHLQNMDL